MLGPAPSPPKRGAARCATGQFLLTVSAIALLAGIHNVVSINLVAQCLNPAEAAGATSLGAPFAGGLRAEIRRRLGIGGAEDARVASVAVLAPPATSRRPVAARATSHAALPPARVGSSAAAQRLAQLVAPSNILLMSSVSSRAADEARMQARALARALARGAEGGASSSKGGPRALGSGGASAALPADRFTTQTCYFQTDESEICTYEGALCYDGESVVVSLDENDLDAAGMDSAADGDDGMLPPFASPAECTDERYDEPSAVEFDGGCAAHTGIARNRWSVLTGAGAHPLPPRRPEADAPLPVTGRGWGPANSGRDGAKIRGVPSNLLFGGEEVALPAPAASATAGDAGGPLRVTRRTRVGPRTIDWVDGALWFVNLPSGAVRDEWKWWNRVGALYDALRNNATGWGGGGAATSNSAGGAGAGSPRRVLRPPHAAAAAAAAARAAAATDASAAAKDAPPPPASRSSADFSAVAGTYLGAHPHDGYIVWLKRWQIASWMAIVSSARTQNTASFRINSQWPLPPMDALVLTGTGGEEIDGETMRALPPYQAASLRLATQPDTVRTSAGALRDVYSSSHLLCSRRGAVPGPKPKLLTDRADGWLLRQYAYMMTGLAKEGERSHPRYVPRHVTFFDLPGRGEDGEGGRVHNSAAVEAAIRGIGIPYTVVRSLDGMSFKQRLALIAKTGILVAPHGSAMIYSMFLPAHAVVIELFGAGVRRTTFRYTAESTDVHYYPVFSSVSPPCGGSPAPAWAAALHSTVFYEQCTARNVTSYDAALLPVCASARAAAPIIVPLDMFNQVMYDAVDTISAFSLRNPVWLEIANTTGAINNIPPFKEIQWDRFRKY